MRFSLAVGILLFSGVGGAQVSVNDARVSVEWLDPGEKVDGKAQRDVTIAPGQNEVVLTGFGARAEQVQVAGAWYEPWSAKRLDKDMDMRVLYSTLSAAVNDAVNCEVTISRAGFRGYGMMIAEVGLPPGAEVDRGVLEGVVDDWNNGVDSYEVSPDHVTFYVWPRAADVKFRFLFRPRFEMKARAAQSVLYDFYNPESRVVLAPERFVVNQ